MPMSAAKLLLLRITLAVAAPPRFLPLAPTPLWSPLCWAEEELPSSSQLLSASPFTVPSSGVQDC